ncbi:nuclear transport factor 2 family protein [Streptacidiphilus melanogenes]|uniref:nuclear transport factor 2 family protein n=1 Tax=Streptacidiphilus melanogenes TaxID=411235 RepID=UPI0005A7C646|nr:nuclear transport factor 2 family protein [Streptacidiphilus melanogenes]
MSSTLSGADTVAGWLTTWAAAEREGDSAALGGLLHEEFRGVGPFGFVLDREQWLRRFADGLHYSAFTFAPDEEVREVAGTALIIGTQEQAGTYQGRPTDGAFRATLLLTGGPGRRLVGIHLSLRTPPAPPTPPAA